MARLHNLMPVILPTREAERAWLSDELKPADHRQLLVPYDADRMCAYAVTTQVNSPANKDAGVLEAA